MVKKLTSVGLPMFIILPVVGFIISLFNFRSKTSGFIFIAFSTLFGYAISFSDSSADSFRYAYAFSNFDNTLDYNKIVNLYQIGELRDMYRLLLFYFVSIFSKNPKVMYAIAGLIYGVLSYLCILTFVNNSGRKDSYVTILAVIFFTYVSLSNINGFRFNTGALLLYLSVYQFILKKKTLWVIGILCTPLFHYGFTLIIPVLLIYKLIERFLYNDIKVNSLLVFIFVICFFASWVITTNTIKLGFLSDTSLISGAVADRMNYINSAEVADLVSERADNSLFLSVQKYFLGAIKIYLFVMIFILLRSLKKISGNKVIFNRLCAFVIFFYSFSFIATSIPSGGRFLNIAHLFFILLLVKFYSLYGTKHLKNLIIIAIPVFSFNIIFTNLVIPFLILSPTFFYGNVFWIIMEGLDFYII